MILGLPVEVKDVMCQVEDLWLKLLVVKTIIKVGHSEAHSVLCLWEGQDLERRTWLIYVDHGLKYWLGSERERFVERNVSCIVGVWRSIHLLLPMSLVCLGLASAMKLEPVAGTHSGASPVFVLFVERFQKSFVVVKEQTTVLHQLNTVVISQSGCSSL